MKADILSHVDQVPPALARFCARINGKPKTLKQIAKESGLSFKTAYWIALQPTWANVSFGEAMKFAAACGLDLLRPRRKLFYLRRACSSGEAGLKTLAGSMPVSYVVRQIKIIQQYEAKAATKHIIPNGRRAAKAS